MRGPALTNPLGHIHYLDAGPTVSVAFWDVRGNSWKTENRKRKTEARGQAVDSAGFWPLAPGYRLFRLVDDLVVGIDDVVVTTGSFV